MPAKSLEEWLVFTAHEMQILEYVRQLGAAPVSPAALIGYVKNIDLALILRLSIKYPEVSTICKHPALNGVWDQHLRRINFSESLCFECRPQPTIQSLDLLKGMLVYANHKKRSVSEDPQDQQMAMGFLELSADLGCFLALNKLCQLQLKKAAPDIELVFRSAQKAASLYLTPGYLLLAVCNYSFKLNLEALKSLILAEKLMPHSAVYIYNAYLGRTVDQIVSNSFGDLNSGKVTLAKLADIPLSHVAKNIYPAMEEQMRSILGALPVAAVGDIENGSIPMQVSIK